MIVPVDVMQDRLRGLPIDPSAQRDVNRKVMGVQRALEAWLGRPVELPEGTPIPFTENTLTDQVGHGYLTYYGDPTQPITLVTPMTYGGFGGGLSIMGSLNGGFDGNTGYGGFDDGSLDGYGSSIVGGADSYGGIRIVGDGVFCDLANIWVSVTYYPMALPSSYPLDMVIDAIMDVAERSVIDIHSNSRGRGMPPRDSRYADLQKPTGWQPDELAQFARLQRKVVMS